MSRTSLNRSHAAFKEDGIFLSQSSKTPLNHRSRSQNTHSSTSSLSQHWRDHLERKNAQLTSRTPVKDAFDGDIVRRRKSNTSTTRGSARSEPSRSMRSFVSRDESYRAIKNYLPRVVSFDSDEESENEEMQSNVSDFSLDSSVHSNDHEDEQRFCLVRLCIRIGRTCEKFHDLPYQTRFKLAVMGLKCIQTTITLFWTLAMIFEKDLGHVMVGKFLWINYMFIGVYFSLYITVRMLGFFHGKWKLTLIFSLLTISQSHVAAVTTLLMGAVTTLPIILGFILIVGIDFLVINLKQNETPLTKFLAVIYILSHIAYFVVVCVCIIMSSIYVADVAFDQKGKQWAGYHCALIIGPLYGCFVINEIHQFLDGRRLGLDGSVKDYLLAAVVI